MRHLIIEKDLGLFLGYYKGLFLFAKENVLPVTKVPSYESIEEAEYYISQYLPKKNKKYGTIKVATKERYVSVVEIVKQGYTDYTHDMINYLPMLTETIH
jgi:hypothetical protein